MAGWVGNIEKETLDNSNFRTVLFTGANIQLTVMSIKAGEEIGLEMHDHLDQFLRVEGGQAKLTMGPSKDEIAVTHDLSDDWVVIVPGGTWHNVINTGDGDLKLYSLYSPPEHPDGTIHVTRSDAEADEHDH